MNSLTPKDFIPLYPNLRFPQFNSSWNSVKLGQIASFDRGSGISKADILVNGNNKCIRYGELYTVYKELIKEVVSRTNTDISTGQISKSNDILMPTSDVTPRGLATASALREDGVIIGGDILIIRSDKLDNLFFCYYIRSHKKDIMRLVNGVTVYHLYGSDLATMNVAVPAIAEQQKIASFLSSVDEWIENLRLQKESLEKYKTGMMQKLFSQKIRFKDEKGKEFPEWKEKKLGEVATFRRGSFPQPYGLPKWYDEVNGTPFVQVYDVDTNMKLKINTKQKISNIAKPMSVYVKKGSIVLTIQGSIGRIALTQYDAYVDRTLLIFQSFKSPVDNVFFLYVVHLLFEIEKRKAPGGTIKTITKEALSSFKIYLPSLEEQKKIGSFLNYIDVLIELKDSQIANAELWKKGLLQKMFI